MSTYTYIHEASTGAEDVGKGWQEYAAGVADMWGKEKASGIAELELDLAVALDSAAVEDAELDLAVALDHVRLGSVEVSFLKGQSIEHRDHGLSRGLVDSVSDE